MLVVEDQDQDSVRTVVVQTLTQKGYRVSIAANGEEALRVASALSEPIQILVTDVVMPGMAGPELAARLRRGWPSLCVLFMSSYTDRGESAILNDPSAAYIQKPFLPEALARQLRDLLDRSIQRGQDSRI